MVAEYGQKITKIAKEELPSISVYHYEDKKHKSQKEISVNWICITAFAAGFDLFRI
jgi:hypothetical protein